MGIFTNLQFVIDLPITASYKSKEAVKRKITDGNGIVSYIVNRNSHFLVRDADAHDVVESYKCRRAKSYGVPVVTTAFLDACLDAGTLTDYRKHVPDDASSSTKSNFDNGKIQKSVEVAVKPKPFHFNAVKVWKYRDVNGPALHDDVHVVAKAILLRGRVKKGFIPFCMLEIHIGIAEYVYDANNYCVFVHHGTIANDGRCDGTKECRYFPNANEASLAFQHLYKTYTSPPTSMTRTLTLLGPGIGSDAFRPEEWLNNVATCVSDEVAAFVSHLWAEVEMTVETHYAMLVKELKMETLESGKALLREMLQEIKRTERTDEAKMRALNDEYDRCLPRRNKKILNDRKDVLEEEKACCLLEDLLMLNECGDRYPGIDFRYQALGCNIKVLENASEEYAEVMELIDAGDYAKRITVDSIYEVRRPLEMANCADSVCTPLFYASNSENVVGILRKGLKMLDDIKIAYKNSDEVTFQRGLPLMGQIKVKGTRMALVFEVALGQTVHIGNTLVLPDEAESYCYTVDGIDKYVVPRNQQKIKYVVEYHLADDYIDVDKVFICERKPDRIDEESNESNESAALQSVDLHHLLHQSDSKVKAGLQTVGTVEHVNLPLRSVHVRAKMVDLAAEVTLVQEFQNAGKKSVNAKYVFPLDEKAAVCGFEAFTEGRHFVGRIEEKAEAQKEYKEAVQRGKKAFLMDA